MKTYIVRCLEQLRGPDNTVIKKQDLHYTPKWRGDIGHASKIWEAETI